MHKHLVSDIFCLSQPNAPVDTDDEILYTIKGVTCARVCRRQQETQNSDVFPAGCMGNKQDVDLATINEHTKRHARLSYDEQERAMNILAKIHEARKVKRLEAQIDQHRAANGAAALYGDDERRRFRLTVRKSTPVLADLEYMLELIKQMEAPRKSATGPADCEGGGDEDVRVQKVALEPLLSPTLVSPGEVRYFQNIMLKERAMPFFMSRFRNNSVPSSIERNPITGVGMDFGMRRSR